MPLPSVYELNNLSKEIKRLKEGGLARWPVYQEVLKRLVSNSAKKSAAPALQSAISHGASGVAHLGSGLKFVAFGSTTVVSLAGIGAAIGPWIGALDIYAGANKHYQLYDLMEAANGKGELKHYSCKCGKCADNIKYIIDKQEGWMGYKAVGIFTFGLPLFGKAAFEIGKGVKSKVTDKPRRSHEVSDEIVKLARETGCQTAMGTIFLLSDRLLATRKSNITTATAIILSQNGGEVLRSMWALTSI